MSIIDGILTQDDVRLEVDGMAYSGWTGVAIERGIDQLAGRFNLRLAAKERTEAEDWSIADGAACRVTLGDEVLITGWVDAVTRFLSSEERGIEISGRDRTGDLVDCSAVHTPGSWTNRRLEEIATELTEPFGIPVETVGETGAPFAKFALQPGETVFEAIERMARYRGLVAWSSGDGAVRVGDPVGGRLINRLTEGVNVLSASSGRDQNERFSEYIVKGQASGSDRRSGTAVAQVSARASDAGVTRHRPLLLVGEEQSDPAALERRARWEATVRWGRSQPAEISVLGWSDLAGRAFRPGVIAQVDVPSVELSGSLLIERVMFERDAESGTTTRFAMVPPQAWSQLPEPEPEVRS